MSEQLHDYDPAEALDSAEAIEVFMADALETGDAAYVAKAEEVEKRAMQRIRDGAPAQQLGSERIFPERPRERILS